MTFYLHNILSTTTANMSKAAAPSQKINDAYNAGCPVLAFERTDKNHALAHRWIWDTIRRYGCTPDMKQKFAPYVDEPFYLILWSQIWTPAREDGGLTKFGKLEMYYQSKGGVLRSYLYDGRDCEELLDNFQRMADIQGWFESKVTDEPKARQMVTDLKARVMEEKAKTIEPS